VEKSKKLYRIKMLQKYLMQSLSSFVFMLFVFLALFISPLNPLRHKHTTGKVRFYKLYSDISALQQRKISTAIELYRLEKGKYPASLDELVREQFLLKQDLTYPWGREYYYNIKDDEYILLQPGR
jgi:hypothetical protein